MSAEHQLIFTDAVHPAAGTLQAENQAAFELLFAFSQLVFADSLHGKLMHHFLDQLRNFFGLLGRCPRIHGEQAAVRLRAMIRIHGVGQSALLPDFLEQA
ncbi:hypothetical protein D3C81_1422320 [compost metagenome]